MAKKKTKREIKREAGVERKTTLKRKVPLGIKLIAVLFLIMAVLSVVNGVIYTLGRTEIASALQEEILQSGADSASVQSMIPIIVWGIIGVYFLGGVIYLVLGIGLWKIKRWARITTIILAILSIAVGLFAIKVIFSDWMSAAKFVATIIIAAYLLFSKEIKNAFAKR
jgi:uncharacterized membrane protein